MIENASAAANKLKKELVQYQEQPKGDQKYSLYLHFQPESSSCKRVEGQINPDGWCVLWVKKA